MLWLELLRLVRAIGIDVVVPVVRDVKATREREALQGYAAGRSAHDAASAAGHNYTKPCPANSTKHYGCSTCGGTGRVPNVPIAGLG
jgi:hypothetical protein